MDVTFVFNELNLIFQLVDLVHCCLGGMGASFSLECTQLLLQLVKIRARIGTIVLTIDLVRIRHNAASPL